MAGRLENWPTHVEMQVSDPALVRSFLEKTVGFKFSEPAPGVLLSADNLGEAGLDIHKIDEGEDACTVPFMDTSDLDAAVEKAVRAGATVKAPRAAVGNPTQPIGWTCYLSIPGSLTVGLWQTNAEAQSAASGNGSDKGPRHKNYIMHFQLASPAPAETRTFLSELFGWTWHEAHNKEDEDTHRMAQAPTSTAAGVHVQKAETPSTTFYLSTEGISGLAQEMVASDATIETGPLFVGHGFYSHLKTPGGGRIGLWQNRDIAWNWFAHMEIVSSDFAATKKFLADGFAFDFWEHDGFAMVLKHGHSGLGLRAKKDTEQTGTVGALWCSAISRSVEAAVKAGAKLITPQHDVGGHGLQASLEAPGGVLFDIWEVTSAPRPMDLRKEIRLPNHAVHLGLFSTEALKTAQFFTDAFSWSCPQKSNDAFIHVTTPKHGQVGVHVQASEQPTSICYFSATDLEVTADKLVSLGAKITVPKTAVGTDGHFCHLMAPGGVVLGLWEDATVQETGDKRAAEQATDATIEPATKKARS